MSKYKFDFRPLVMLFIVVLLVTCGRSIFGPSEVREEYGEKGDIDRALDRAEDLYIGASGDNNEEKLTSAVNIYLNVLARADINDTQRMRAARGFSKAALELEISDPGEVVDMAMQIYEEFDYNNFTFSNQAKVDEFIVITSGALDVLDQSLEYMYVTKYDNREEQDFASMSILNLLAFCIETTVFADAYVTAMGQMADINDGYDAFTSNQIEFLATGGTNTWLSNQMLSNVQMVSNGVLGLTGNVGTSLEFLNRIETRMTNMTWETRGSDNILTTSLNEQMDIVITPLRQVNQAFEDMGTPGSDLSEWLQYLP